MVVLSLKFDMFPFFSLGFPKQLSGRLYTVSPVLQHYRKVCARIFVAFAKQGSMNGPLEAVKINLLL